MTITVHVLRPPDKSAISQPKHMLWVLKRTVSISYFEHPKMMFKLMGKDIITITLTRRPYPDIYALISAFTSHLFFMSTNVYLGK